MPTLDEILETYHARPIPNCPGRYVLPGRMTQCPPERIVGDGFAIERFEDTPVKDTVVITRIDDWGLISYLRPDGSWCHTANDPSGFARKLRALGVPDRNRIEGDPHPFKDG